MAISGGPTVCQSILSAVRTVLVSVYIYHANKATMCVGSAEDKILKFKDSEDYTEERESGIGINNTLQVRDTHEGMKNEKSKKVDKRQAQRVRRAPHRREPLKRYGEADPEMKREHDPLVAARETFGDKLANDLVATVCARSRLSHWPQLDHSLDTLARRMEVFGDSVQALVERLEVISHRIAALQEEFKCFETAPKTLRDDGGNSTTLTVANMTRNTGAGR